MHRAIDRLTDHDEDVRALNARLRSRHGRYAPVVTDVAFDYFLWRNWDDFGPEDFDEFSQRSYANLYARRAVMPERVRGYVNGMVKDDWLQLYTTREGLGRVFDRMLPRLSRPELLAGVNETIAANDAAFNQALRAVFPRLQTLADAYR